MAAALRPELTKSEVATLVSESCGLVMEFVHMAAVGQRLNDVLHEQGRAIATGTSELAAHLARIILTAHVAGFSVAASELEMEGVGTNEISRALGHLVNEHVVLERGGVWQGMHILRSVALVDELHALHPPCRPL